jgi:hypothetical protein
MADTKTCKHDGCDCAATGDSDYCSPYCETAGDAGTIEIACGCNHPGCPGSAIV